MCKQNRLTRAKEQNRLPRRIGERSVFVLSIFISWGLKDGATDSQEWQIYIVLIHCICCIDSHIYPFIVDLNQTMSQRLYDHRRSGSEHHLKTKSWAKKDSRATDPSPTVQLEPSNFAGSDKEGSMEEQKDPSPLLECSSITSISQALKVKLITLTAPQVISLSQFRKILLHLRLRLPPFIE